MRMIVIGILSVVLAVSLYVTDVTDAIFDSPISPLPTLDITPHPTRDEPEQPEPKPNTPIPTRDEPTLPEPPPSTPIPTRDEPNSPDAPPHQPEPTRTEKTKK